MEWVWEAHNVDSHVLAEMVFEKNIKPFQGLYCIEYLQYNRRSLHVQNYKKGHIRRRTGGTVSLGIPRGSMVKYRGDIYYVGGNSGNRISLHIVQDGKRKFRNVKLEDVMVLYRANSTVKFFRKMEGAIHPTTKVVGTLCA